MRNWFKKGGSKGEREYSVDELIVLERYEEAERRLSERLKRVPKDLHARLKLAEVQVGMGTVGRAIENYRYVADMYAEDGFHEKAIALLSRAVRLSPADDSLRTHIRSLERGKTMDRQRQGIIDALRAASKKSGGSATSTIELEQMWSKLGHMDLIRDLPDTQLQHFFAAAQIARFHSEEELALEGEETPELYLIVEGEIEAYVLRDGAVLTVRTFGDGAVIGESVLLEKGRWPAHYRTLVATTVLRLTPTGLQQALLGNPDPRQLLQALRSQKNDRDVRESLGKLRVG